MIKQYGSVTSSQTSNHFDITTRAARMLLNKMIADGLIVKKGSARSTYYTAPPQRD